MNLVSHRLLLRAIEFDDAELLMELINDGEVERMICGWSFPVSYDEQKKWIASLSRTKDVLRYIIDDRIDNKSIGTIIVSDIDFKNGTSEIHIKLRENAKCKGYGTESIKMVTDYLFRELRLNCVCAYVISSNHASQKLFENCGFAQEGVLRSRVYKNGEFQDVLSYSVLNDMK